MCLLLYTKTKIKHVPHDVPLLGCLILSGMSNSPVPEIGTIVSVRGKGNERMIQIAWDRSMHIGSGPWQLVDTMNNYVIDRR